MTHKTADGEAAPGRPARWLRWSDAGIAVLGVAGAAATLLPGIVSVVAFVVAVPLVGVVLAHRGVAAFVPRVDPVTTIALAGGFVLGLTTLLSLAIVQAGLHPGDGGSAVAAALVVAVCYLLAAAGPHPDR